MKKHLLYPSNEPISWILSIPQCSIQFLRLRLLLRILYKYTSFSHGGNVRPHHTLHKYTFLSHGGNVVCPPHHHTLYNDISFSHADNIRPHHTFCKIFFVYHVYKKAFCYTLDSRIFFSHARTCTCYSTPYCRGTVEASKQEFP